MENFSFYNRGQSLIGVIIILVVAGVIIGGLYYYFQKQTPKEPEGVASQANVSREILPEEKMGEKTVEELSSPQVYLSSNRLEQGDTLLVKIATEIDVDEVSGEFESREINFFKSATTKDWIGIVGIDARKEPGNYDLVINLPNSIQFKKELNIIEREFPVTELLVTKELEERGFTPSKIVENVVNKENLILREVLSIYTPKAYFNKAFINPLKEIKVVGAFGNIRKSGGLGIQHLGVDLEADIGTPVYAINNGIVRFSEDLNTYGKTLIIDHGFGIFSLYLHLNKFNVLPGKEIERGEVIGFSGNTGYSIAPHLHFSLKVNGASIDPLRFIKTIEYEITH